MSDDKPMLEETGVSENSRKHFKYRSTTCLNCSHPLDLSDRYCPYCSQLNSTKSLSFKDFFGEFFNSIISYDSRLRYTVRDLLFKPGTITYNFVNGQRLRYANPFRFFLSVSIIFFILNQLAATITGDDNINFNNTEKTDDGIVQWSTGKGTDSINLENEIEKAMELQKANEAEVIPTATIANIEKTSEAAAARKKASDSLWAEMNKNYKKDYKKGYDQSKQQLGTDLVTETEAKQESVVETRAATDLTTETKVKNDSASQKKVKKDSAKTKMPVYITQATIDTISYAQSIAERLNTYWKFYDNTQIKNTVTALDSLGHERTKTNVWLYEKNFAYERFKEKPSDFIAYALNKVPFFLFFFTPIFALFFWLIYAKKKHTYMEHTVFIFHIFSFIFLASLLLILPEAIFNTEILTGILFGLIGPFYFYKALRNFYKQSRLITIIKFVFLNFVFLISSTFAAAVFFLITAATY